MKVSDSCCRTWFPPPHIPTWRHSPSAVLSNIAAKAPNELTQYKTMLGLWDGAPGASSAQPIANSSFCNSLVLPGFNAATTPCAEKFQAVPTALATEYVIAFRIDQKLGDHDNAFYRYKLDHGVQPTTLDAINANFDALSNQPAWDNQFQETHIFGPRATNQYIMSLSHYVAQFAQDPTKVASTFPYQVSTSGAVPFTSFNSQGSFPQGRNVTQYQFIDDYTLVIGKHNIKVGENYRRYDVKRSQLLRQQSGRRTLGSCQLNGLQQFVNGIGYQYRKTLNQASDVPVALWGIGAYVHDDWSVKPGLKITLGLRFEHNSSQVCRVQLRR